MPVLDIEWDGKEYRYDPEAIDMATAIAIKQQTGWGLKSWGREIDDMNAEALNALWFAIRNQAGESVNIGQCKVQEPLRFYNEVQRATVEAINADLSERAGKAQATKSRPTKTSKSSGTKTSSGSPTGATSGPQT